MAIEQSMRRRPLCALALALSALTLAPAALAQDYAVSPQGGIHAGQLDVPLNKSQLVTLDRPYGRAMIGNDKVADIIPISDRSIYVLGKAAGTTSLTVFDKQSRVIAVIDLAVGPDIVSLRRQISELIPGQNISAHIANDSIVLSGIVNDGASADRAVQLAKTFAGDKVVNMMAVGSSQQVMLEVRFSEINRQAGKQIGVSSFFNNASGSFDAVTGSSAALGVDPDTGAGVLQLSTITDTFGVFRKSFSVAGLDVLGMLDALERKGMAKTLAEPTLVALSGEKASFLAGGEFPIPVVQNGGGAGGSQAFTIEFKPFGVSLGFTPTVLADGVINMVVEPEVSSIDPAASITVNGLRVPGLQTRRASTTLELRDGESFAMAGLIRQDFQTTVRQLPILGSIPIIGSLFRSSGFQRGETELLIVVTPRLVQPVKPEQIALPTDRVENASETELFLMGRTDKAVPIISVDEKAATAPKSEDPGYDY